MLGCDAVLGEAERLLDPARPPNSRRRSWIAAMAVGLLAFAAWGWLLDHPMDGSNRPTITIGSKDGSEMILLGHMLADLVQAHTPLRVDRRFNLGTRSVTTPSAWRTRCLRRIHRHRAYDDSQGTRSD